VGTVGDLAVLPEAALVSSLGAANGRHLHRLGNGIDEREVEPDQKPRSIGHEETFPADHHLRETLHRELVRLADSTAARLRTAGLAGRTVTIKVRFHDFRTITRSITLPEPIDGTHDLLQAAGALLEKVDPAPGVRLLGVHVSHLGPGGVRQLTFDDAGHVASRDGATDAVDRIRARYGAAAIGPASLAGADGLRVKQRGDQQWGPGEPRPGGQGGGHPPSEVR
jgi:DNA polymerase IV